MKKPKKKLYMYIVITLINVMFIGLYGFVDTQNNHVLINELTYYKEKYIEVSVENVRLRNSIKLVEMLNTEIKVLKEENKNLDKYIKELQELVKTKFQYKVKTTCYNAKTNQCDNTPRIGALNTKIKEGITIAVSHSLKYMLGKYVYIYGFEGKYSKYNGVRKITDLLNKRYKDKRVDILCHSCKGFNNQEVNLVLLPNYNDNFKKVKILRNILLSKK